MLVVWVCVLNYTERLGERASEQERKRKKSRSTRLTSKQPNKCGTLPTPAMSRCCCCYSSFTQNCVCACVFLPFFLFNLLFKPYSDQPHTQSQPHSNTPIHLADVFYRHKWYFTRSHARMCGGRKRQRDRGEHSFMLLCTSTFTHTLVYMLLTEHDDCVYACVCCERCIAHFLTNTSIEASVCTYNVTVIVNVERNRK